MTDRVLDDRIWRQREIRLRYSDFAAAAWRSAKDPFTPPSLVRSLLERHARYARMAEEELKEEKRLEREMEK